MLLKKGFSKIPIYHKENRNKIIGILKVKDLINCLDKFLYKNIGDVTNLSEPLIVS
jgi:CBS domain containing-hemolysin-like protein